MYTTAAVFPTTGHDGQHATTPSAYTGGGGGVSSAPPPFSMASVAYGPATVVPTLSNHTSGDSRRSARTNPVVYQATSSVLKEKLSPQNALMPTAMMNPYQSLTFGHAPVQAPLHPGVTTPMPFAVQPHMLPGAGAGAGQMFFGSPSTPGAPFGMSSTGFFPPSSSLMAAAQANCAAESFLQREIAMAYLSSQQAAESSALQFASGAPTQPSSFLLPHPGAAAAAGVWPASQLQPPPAFGAHHNVAAFNNVSEESRAMGALPSQSATSLASAVSPQQPPLYVVCGNPAAAATTRAALFPHASSGSLTSPTSMSSSDIQSLSQPPRSPQQPLQPQQVPPPQYGEFCLPPTAPSHHHHHHHVLPTSAQLNSNAAATAAAGASATARGAVAVPVEEGKSFEEDPVPIDTTKCQLIVNFLSQRVTNEEFRNLFRPFGELFEHASHIIYDFRHGKGHHHAAAAAGACTNPLNGAPAATTAGAGAGSEAVGNARSKGYGFIYYRDGLSTAAAIRELNGKDLYGRRIKVRYAGQQRSIEDIVHEEEKALLEASVNYLLEGDDDL